MNVRFAFVRAVALCLLACLITTPAPAELIDDPYVLTFADGAGAVAHQLPANTGVAEVFDLSYGSWNIAFVDGDLEIALTINPQTPTPQLLPSVSAGDLDWTPVPGTITGLTRDPISPSALFEVTVISLDGGISASSSSGISFVNQGNEPSVVTWRFLIEVDHVPEPSSFLMAMIGMLGCGLFGWRMRSEPKRAGSNSST